MQRKADGPDDLVNFDRLAAIPIEASAAIERLDIERDAHALDDLVDGDGAVAVTISDARERLAQSNRE
jgi:hypothetical protein